MDARQALCAAVAATQLLVAPAVAGAQRFCGPAPSLGAASLTCRGGAGMAFSAPTDSDLTLVVRPASEKEATDPRQLAPGTCHWATRPLPRPGPIRVVVPLAGPLAREAFPIGHQARVCANDATCVMTMCAYPADGELRAVDGYIKLTFW